MKVAMDLHQDEKGEAEAVSSLERVEETEIEPRQPE